MRAIQFLVGICVLGASLVAVHAQQVYKVGNGVTTPIVIREVKPDYTADAKKAHLEGVVELNATVRADGTVSDIAVTRSLDSTFGLDQQAVEAMKQWTFTPGTKDGKAVAVRVDIQMKFTLK